MVISIIQPCFVPWLGYFEQMAIADVFVYMDDVQYTKKDWRNNNQLKSPNGMRPIYVPLRNASRSVLINEVLISYNEKWEDVLLNKIYEWYKKAPFYDEIMELIRPVIYNKHEKLVELNYSLNRAICSYLGIKTPIYFSSNIPRNTDNKNKRIIEICKHFSNVNLLYDGKAAENFIDISLFSQNGITLVFQQYIQNPYPQLWGEFIPYTSIIDVMMNCGKDARKILLSNPMSNHLKKRNII